MARDLTEDLKRHPHTKKITFAGEQRYFSFGKRAFDIAREQGADIGEVLSGIEEIDEEDLEGGDFVDVHGLMDMIADILWIGFLPFEEELPRQWVHGMITVPDLRDITEQIRSVLSVEAETPEAKKKD